MTGIPPAAGRWIGATLFRGPVQRSKFFATFRGDRYDPEPKAYMRALAYRGYWVLSATDFTFSSGELGVTLEMERMDESALESMRAYPKRKTDR